MKKAIVVIIAVLSFYWVPAQTKASLSAKIKTPTVGCESCKSRIESYLKRYDGVTYVLVNWHRKETMVKYLTDRINIEEIKTAISNVGYEADDILETPDSYQRLPKTCKKPKDGGPAKYPNIHGQ